jgi:hypothetical protein
MIRDAKEKKSSREGGQCFETQYEVSVIVSIQLYAPISVLRDIFPVVTND